MCREFYNGRSSIARDLLDALLVANRQSAKILQWLVQVTHRSMYPAFLYVVDIVVCQFPDDLQILFVLSPEL